MASGSRIGKILLIALVVNLGWLWIPLGLLALALASYAFVQATRDRWHWAARILVLVLAWIPLLYVVATSGVTLGIAGKRLLSAGGTERNDLLRAATGLTVPLLAGGLLVLRARGRPKTVAIASLLVWLLIVPAAYWIGAGVGPEPGEPGFGEPTSGWVNIGLLAPFLGAYGLILFASALVWRDGWGASPDRAGPRGADHPG